MTKRIVAVLGDYYHKEELAKQSLELAVQRVEQVGIEYCTVSQLVETLHSDPAMVILFAGNQLNPKAPEVKTWMDRQTAEAIRSYVNKGGSWLAWHSGLASYKNLEEYTSILRGYFEYHPEKHQVVTYYPVENTRFLYHREVFQLLDEHYFVKCDEENTNVFLRSESVDGSSIAGWEHPFGKGQVVCLTPAHLKEGLIHPAFIRILVHCIKKCIQMD